MLNGFTCQPMKYKPYACWLLLLGMLCNSCNQPPGSYTFPQGVASGDPQSTGVMLWTRVIATGLQPSNIAVTLEIARDSAFTKERKCQQVSATADHDFVIRHFFDQLHPYTRYYYRFIAGRDTSRLGRTITAPDTTTHQPVRLATLACQSYEQGFFGTLKTLIETDKNRPEKEQLDVIIHLGDFIYEVVGDDPRNDNHHPQWLIDQKGKQRNIPPFPVGATRLDLPGEWKSGATQPFTTADFRQLYQVYLSNPVMQEARARWPFICTWDDHEFADGNHQSYTPAAEKTGHKGFQTVKTAANQAWFEYIPAALDEATTIAGVPAKAYNFRPTAVENQPIGDQTQDGLYQETNNLKAIQSMCMYRLIPWGKDVLFIVPDTKSYQLPGYSTLGDEQTAWFKLALLKSKAKWKLWLNSEPVSDVQINFSSLPTLGLEDQSLYHDSWANNATSTHDLLTTMQKNQITGVVSLSGDYHIQMAGMAGLDTTPIVPDLTVTSMSSFADFFWLDRKGKSFQDDRITQIFSFSAVDSLKRPNINTAILHGVQTALVYAKTGNQQLAKDLSTPANPWFSYFDCEHNGYLTATVARDTLWATFVNTENARKDYEKNGAPIVSTIDLSLPWWQPGTIPQWSHMTKKGKIFPSF